MRHTSYRFFLLDISAKPSYLLSQNFPMHALHEMYVEVDGKQYTDWPRQFTYREITATN